MEYLLILSEFLYIKGKKSYISFFIIPSIIGVLIYFFLPNSSQELSGFSSNIINILGILIGFSTSIFVMLLTIENKNIDLAKNEYTDIIVFKRKISLFDSIVVGLAYLILVLGFLLILNLVYPFFISFISCAGKVIFCLNISLVIHAIIVLMDVILSFYLIITKRGSF